MRSGCPCFRIGHFFYVYVILATAAILSNVAACTRLPEKAVSPRLSNLEEKDPGPQRLTPEELQRELFQFVDRYRKLVGQVCDEGVGRSANADMRVLYQATKTSYVSAAVSVATSPRLIDALRDLLIMLTLQRMVWESGAKGRIPPADADSVARVLSMLETQIYDLAKRVMPSEAIVKMRNLTVKWRGENPDQHYVAYVRFQNLGASPDAEEVNEIISSGAFLEPVEAVAREAHEARLLAERTLYLANRMPMLIEWQTTLAYQRMAASPEAAGVLDNLDRYRAVLERVSLEINELPQKVAAERRTLVEDFARMIAEERAETIRHIQTLIRSEREALFQDLSKSADKYGPILQQFAMTAVAARDAVAGIERMTAPDGEDADAYATIKRLQEIAEWLATTASAANDTVVGLNSLFSAELRGLASIDAMLASQAQRIFFYAAALVLLLGAVIYTVLHLFRRPTN